MYPWHFYLCLAASLGLVGGLILLAIFPIKLPIVATNAKPKPKMRKLHLPSRKELRYWDDWNGDEDDL